jgi:hypothetical protein
LTLIRSTYKASQGMHACKHALTVNAHVSVFKYTCVNADCAGCFGSQPSPKSRADVATLEYGVSITDPCIGWSETEEVLRAAAEARFSKVLHIMTLSKKYNRALTFSVGYSPSPHMRRRRIHASYDVSSSSVGYSPWPHTV